MEINHTEIHLKDSSVFFNVQSMYYKSYILHKAKSKLLTFMFQGTLGMDTFITLCTYCP